MAGPIQTRESSDVLCVYSLISEKSASAAILNGGQGVLREGRRWVAVRKWLEKKVGSPPIPLLLANGAAIDGIEWIGHIHSVDVHASGTVVEFTDLRRLSAPLPLREIRKASNGERLSKQYIRPYVPCTLRRAAQALVLSALAEPLLANDADLLRKAAAQAIDADPLCARTALTTRRALISARIGQGEFRRDLFRIWNGSCAVTSCSIHAALVASHIRSWAESNNKERLDPFNGLLLCANLDRLFDQGLISFDAQGNLLLAPSIKAEDLRSLGISYPSKLRFIDARHKPYLQAHRKRHQFHS